MKQQGYTVSFLNFVKELGAKFQIYFKYLFVIKRTNFNNAGPGCVAQSVGHLTCKSRGPGFDARSGNILSFLLTVIQEGQLSVTGESMCTKYWITTKEV